MQLVQLSEEVTSRWIAEAMPLFLTISLALASQAPISMSARTTLAPSLAKRAASNAPCPFAAPEIIATLLSSLPMILYLYGRFLLTILSQKQSFYHPYSLTWVKSK